MRAERGRPRLRPTAYTKRPGRWQVSYFGRGDEVVQVIVDDRSGAILEQWTGDQVAWTMARGYEGAFGRKLNAPYVWMPLCLLFLVPFVDPRRPFRLLHLDLLVLLGFGVSHVFFNRGEIDASVPLVYPVLLYLLVRMLLAGLRPRTRSEPLVPLVPLSWLVVGAGFLVAFRLGLNVVDSNVIDVGYAGVIGADRIADGDALYGAGFSEDVERGDTYGPVNYLLYLPFEQALPWSGSWDDLPRRTARRSPSTCSRWAGWCCWACGCGRERGAAAGRCAGLRVGGLPLYGVRARDQLQRHARERSSAWPRCWPDARPRPDARVGAAARRGRRAGGGGQVRPARAGAAVRAGPRRRPLQVLLFVAALAAALAVTVLPLRARRRPARALRPHGRLPGRPALAVQHLGPGDRRSTGCRPW